MLVETGSTIQKGYSISVTSWENDGDHYNTMNMHGLTVTQANFMFDVAKLFKSKHSRSKGFGNSNISDNVCETIVEIVTEQYHSNEEVLKLFDFDVLDENLDKYEFVYFLQESILGYPVEYESDFCRVAESVEMFFLEEDFVVPELKQVKVR